MTRLALVFVSLSFAVAGCGDPSCEETARHAAKLMSQGGAAYGGKVSALDLERGIAICKDEKWSGDLRSCIVSAKDMVALGRCLETKKK